MKPYKTYEDVKPLLAPLLKRKRCMKLAKDVIQDVKDACAIMDMFLNDKQLYGDYTDFHADVSEGSLVLSMDLMFGITAKQSDYTSAHFATLLRISDHAAIKAVNDEVVRLTVTMDIA